MEETLDAAHEEICEARTLFRQRSERLVNLIRHWDPDWLDIWVEEHSPLRDVKP